MKRLVILIILSIIVFTSCAANPKRLVMLGYPKEYYELRGPIKECVVQGFTYDKDNDEWSKGIADDNYPEKYIFNEDGYLISGEMRSGSTYSSTSMHIINDIGNPVERQHLYKQTGYNVFPYERMLIDDEPWYVNTESSINVWYAWNKDEGEETIVVNNLIFGAFSFDEFIDYLKLKIKEDSSKHLKPSCRFVYRKDGSIDKIVKSNKNEFTFDRNGNLINYSSGWREEETYEVISPERTIRKFLSNKMKAVDDISYIRDEYGNWISKETFMTFGDWSARERITREISYYE